MYLRISFHFEDDVELKTIDLNISHFSCCFNDQILSLYDQNLSIYNIPFKYIYSFSFIDYEDAGLDFTCFNDLDFAFKSLGFKEVFNYTL